MFSTRAFSRSLLLLSLSVLVVTPTAAANNACSAKVSIVKSERVGATTAKWRFTFHVKTKCTASTGRFEYSYRIKGSAEKPTIRPVASWNAEKGADFDWTDEVNAPLDVELELVNIDNKSVQSTKL